MLTTVALTPSNAHRLMGVAAIHDISLDPRVAEIAWSVFRQGLETAIDGFAFTLKAFQSEGVRFFEEMLLNRSGANGVLMADEQGLGKTVQAMGFAHKHDLFPMLVALPNVTKFNWVREITAMTGTQHTINVVGVKLSKKRLARDWSAFPHVTFSMKPVSGCDIYLINYDILHANADALSAIDWALCVGDETHRIKNPKAKRTKALWQIFRGETYKVDGKDSNGRKAHGMHSFQKVGKGARNVIMMTGTPFVNKTRELWTTLHLLDPITWDNEGKFLFTYCDPKKIDAGRNGVVTTFNGASNAAKLNLILTSTVMIRRLKKDVLTELPPKSYVTVSLDFDRTEYDALVEELETDDMDIGSMFGNNGPIPGEALVKLGKLRKAAGMAKVPSVIDWTVDFVGGGEKIVLFAHHRDVVDGLVDGLRDAFRNAGEDFRVVKIQGGMSASDVDMAKVAFQTDATVKVIVISTQAGAEGLTLTAASNVGFVQLPWTTGLLQQASDRVHRISQESPVTVWNLLAFGTVEERIADIIMTKGGMMDAVLDGGETINFIENLGTADEDML